MRRKSFKPYVLGIGIVCVTGLLLSFAPTIFGSSHAAKSDWEPISTINGCHKRHEATFVQVGDVFCLMGGRRIQAVDVYNPLTNMWYEGNRPPIELHHFQPVVIDGQIFILGAMTGPYPYEIPIANIFIYDVIKDRWIVGPQIPTHRRRSGAGTVVYKDKIYLVSGIINGHRSGWVPWLDEFDPATNTWRELPDAPHSRDHFQAVVIGDKIYAAGGRRSGSGETVFHGTEPAVDVFDFETGTWETLPADTGNIPTPRAGCSAIELDGEVVIFGGESPRQQLAHSEVEALNVDRGTWRSMPPLLVGRHGTAVISNPRGLFTAGGCAHKGGEPELTNLHWRPSDDPTAPVGTPIEPGTLELKSVTKEGKKSVRVTLANTGGNQGLVVTYALAIGGGTVDFPPGFPYVLPPDETMDLVVDTSSSSKGDVLLVRELSNEVDPLEVPLT